jgi:molecular chaperone Hsp33
MDSTLHSFLLDDLPVRGAFVRLGQDWRDLVLRRWPSPERRDQLNPVIQLLGQMTASALLLQNSIRFEGCLGLHIQGDSHGPIRLAIAQVQADLGFRSTCQMQSGDVGRTGIDTIHSQTDWQGLVNAHGQGRCVLLLEPAAHQKGVSTYQGHVALTRDSEGGGSSDSSSLPPSQGLARDLAHYMACSEQVPSYFVLWADEHVAAGLLIQRMPVGGQSNLEAKGYKNIDVECATQADEDFARIAWLASTVKPEEFTQLDAATLLGRLFAQENWTCHMPRIPHFRCTCSRERMSRFLQTLGVSELQALITEQGGAQIDCEFCGQIYRWTPQEIGVLMTGISG